MKANIPQAKPQNAFVRAEIADDKAGGHALREDGCQRRTLNPQMKAASSTMFAAAPMAAPPMLTRVLPCAAAAGAASLKNARGTGMAASKWSLSFIKLSSMVTLLTLYHGRFAPVFVEHACPLTDTL